MDLELPKRSRFYQSSMDMDYLNKGGRYRDLPNSKVLFLCTFDPFGMGEAEYVFTNLCHSNTEIELLDGTTKIFYNCTCPLEKVPEELKDFYRYIQTGVANSELTRNINHAVEKAKQNEKWRSQYMKELVVFEDIRTDALAEGIEIGISQGKALDILELLEELGDVPEDVRSRIEAEKNMDCLKKWHKLSARSVTIEEFIKQSGM